MGVLLFVAYYYALLDDEVLCQNAESSCREGQELGRRLGLTHQAKAKSFLDIARLRSITSISRSVSMDSLDSGLFFVRYRLCWQKLSV